MIDRLAQFSRTQSFFILGPRGVGKSTLIKNQYIHKKSMYIDLLDPKLEDQYRIKPELLSQQLASQAHINRVIIDEVQKLPRLLNVAHQLIEDRNIQFILSGSSARKLRRGKANLLAGRAFVFHLHPFSCFELKKSFKLKDFLQWGALPGVFKLKNARDKKEYLKSYALFYLKEEIQVEQLVRHLSPFRKFLDVSAQMNGKIINFSKIANDLGVDTSTVQNYYSILEDTLIGFYLPAYHKSIRKGQKLAPKFYLFDTGICRSLTGSLDVPLLPQTYAFGEAFEHFIILEFMKLAEYFRKDWKFYYLSTKNNLEIDLIIDRPHEKTLCVEIKSSDSIQDDDVKTLNSIGKSIPNSQLYCLSRDTERKKIKQSLCLHWHEALKEIFKIKDSINFS